MKSHDDVPTVLAPQQQIDEIIWSFTRPRLVYAAAKLGIPDLLRTGPCSASAIAQSLKTDADITYRLMRGLAWCGLLDHGDDDGFSLTPLGRCLCSDVDGSMYDNAISMGEMDWPVWSHLVDLMKSGPPAFPRAFGMNLFEYFARNEAAGRRFDGLMEQFSATVSEEIVENCDFSGYRTFVDVGGGKAQLATAILEANPHLQGTVLDRPSVIERTSSHLTARGDVGPAHAAHARRTGAHRASVQGAVPPCRIRAHAYEADGIGNGPHRSVAGLVARFQGPRGES